MIFSLIFFFVLFIKPIFALQTDPTEIGDILTNTSEKTLVIALGPSNQMATWRDSAEYYGLYSSILETWDIKITGIPSFTFTDLQEVPSPMWVRPSNTSIPNASLYTIARPGQKIIGYPSNSSGAFLFELLEMNITGNVPSNEIIYRNHFLPPNENYPYKANISLFRSTLHNVSSRFIYYAPSSGSPGSNGPKIRLRWGTGLTTQTYADQAITWDGGDLLTSVTSDMGKMPTGGDTWSPIIDITGTGNDEGNSVINGRPYVVVSGESGVAWFPMGRLGGGYQSNISSFTWLSETEITNDGWTKGLEAIRPDNNYTRLIVFDHIGLADALTSSGPIPSTLETNISEFYERIRNVSNSANFSEIRIIGIVDPLIPAADLSKLIEVAREKLQAAQNDSNLTYFINLAEVYGNYSAQPSEWLADSRHNTYNGTVEIMKLLWKELTTYYGTDGIIYWETSSRKVTNKTIDSQTLLFNNTDTRERPVRLFNLTDSLIYFQNGSVVCSNISACMGNINYTLNAGNYTYVLDNFNLTEGETRNNSPVSFISSSTTQKNINSTLNSSINMTVVASVSSCDISSVSLDGANPSYSCENSKITINITQIDAGNNILSISYPAAAAAATNDPGGGTPAEWRGTFAEDKVELSALGSITKNFGVKYRVKFKVHNETHHVGILNLTDKSVTIEVASTPQKAELFVGDEERFELNGDEFYDIKVRLNKINQDRAEISVFYIQEEVEKEKKIDFSDEETSSYEIAIVAGAIIVVVIGVFVWVIARRLKK